MDAFLGKCDFLFLFLGVTTLLFIYGEVHMGFRETEHKYHG